MGNSSCKKNNFPTVSEPLDVIAGSAKPWEKADTDRHLRRAIASVSKTEDANMYNKLAVKANDEVSLTVPEDIVKLVLHIRNGECHFKSRGNDGLEIIMTRTNNGDTFETYEFDAGEDLTNVKLSTKTSKDDHVFHVATTAVCPDIISDVY